MLNKLPINNNKIIAKDEYKNIERESATHDKLTLFYLPI